jgi:hypothetical protein
MIRISMTLSVTSEGLIAVSKCSNGTSNNVYTCIMRLMATTLVVDELLNINVD